jgi:DNA-binding NarL/FixJ family response regulator
VVAAVGNGEALLAAVAEHHPDVTVVDVRMPPGYTDEGLRAAIEIRRHHSETGVLVFSQYIETRYAADLLGATSGVNTSSTSSTNAPHRRAGGVGYLLKDRVADVGEFIEALSPSSASRRPTPITAGCSPCSGICRRAADDGHHYSFHISNLSI